MKGKLGALIVTSLTLAVPDAALANPVSAWMDTTWKYKSEATRPPAPFTPPEWKPEAAAANTRVAVAMFEAANAAERRYRPYFNLEPASGPASAEAAVSVAAHAVLIDIFPDKKRELDEALAHNLAEVADGPAKKEGERLGLLAAAAALKREVYEPKGPFPPYVPPTTVGRYVSTIDPGPQPPNFGYRTWLLPSWRSVSIAPPPEISSETYARSYNETMSVGAKDSKARTPAQTAAAKFWANAAGLFAVQRLVAARQGRRTVDTARLAALIELAVEDAAAVVDNSKLKILRWRPVTAIRLGASDGNDATSGDPNWQPLLRTPLSPEYPCGHCTIGAVMATIMSAEVGPEMPEAQFISSSMPAASTLGMRWSDFQKRVSESRIYGGVHFRYSAEAGEALGKEVALIARANFAQPLRPERRGRR
jgi:hypothetical protein